MKERILQYRVFTTADIPLAAELYVHAFNAPPWNDQWTTETASKRLTQMLNRDSAYGLLAYDEDGLCGLIVGDEEQFYDGPQFQIREFCVDNSRRGQGLGTAIYRELEQRMKQRGVVTMLLYTLRHPATEGFYRRQGFVEAEELALMCKKI